MKHSSKKRSSTARLGSAFAAAAFLGFLPGVSFASDAKLSDDTYVLSGNGRANLNYGSATSMTFGPNDPAYVRFDFEPFSGINVGKGQIAKATLKLWLS